ncbi:MAG: LCP family protein [Clostridiaceae bacterium]|jgi:LCP family protein required for cell wall assembly|nr:LCP family protein [Clostridiaceae bacterium]
MSNKKGNNGLLILVIILSIILVGVMGLYFYIVKDDPVFQFIGRIISTKDGAESIRSRRESNDKPYDLTNNQRYSKDLVDKNNINILIIGPDETSSNYDTLMIASIDDENNTVKLINLPRDIYIDYSDKFKKDLKKKWSSYSKSKGIYKINAAHLLGEKVNYMDGKGRFGKAQYDFTADIIEEIFNIYIDDYIYIKPSSFRKLVDYFGGVEIDVPYLMKYKDPTQNLDINIKKGLQTLNGKDAEGFVRYRQGIDEKGKYKSIGDIERKNNQTTFVKAFLDQHMNLKNLGKIITIFNDLNSYIETSVNAREAGEYGKLAETLYKNKFTKVSEEIECKNVDIGGIYYLKISQK